MVDPLGAEKAKLLQHNPLSTMPSRILGDIRHLMAQLPIKRHGLRRPFARALRDAFFDYDLEDKATITSFLDEKGVTFESMLCQHPTWLLQRVKRFVPSPEKLFERVSKTFSVYGPLKDAKPNGQPLFREDAWDNCKTILENIQRGYYSDPPNISLYFTHGKDKYGLMRYRCIRGTNGIEIGVHQNVIWWFGTFNTAPDFAVELLRDYVLYHNLKVSSSLTTECKC
jgi:hypothetical protein